MLNAINAIGECTVQNRKGYIFPCKLCSKEIRVRKCSLSYHTGMCRSCASAHNVPPHKFRYTKLVRTAKYKDIFLSLSFDEYLTFVGNPCHYCGCTLNWEPRDNHSKRNQCYNIDRKDSSKGYILENCIPCCRNCNTKKGVIPYEIFKLRYEAGRP